MSVFSAELVTGPRSVTWLPTVTTFAFFAVNESDVSAIMPLRMSAVIAVSALLLP